VIKQSSIEVIPLPTAQLSTTNEQQSVILPVGIYLPGETAVVRTDGMAIILEPAKSNEWPVGFFEAIRIEDPAFFRPEQCPIPAKHK
jgi:virulence-associated protein VagC